MTSNPNPDSRQLLEALEQPDASFKDIGIAIGQWDELYREVLRQANSVEFSLQHDIVEIRHAIAVLGQNRLRQIAEKVFYRMDQKESAVPATHFGNRPANHPGSPKVTDQVDPGTG